MLENKIYKGLKRRFWSDNALPNVIILGAQKAATTSLFNYLIQNPSIGGGITKEIHFFDHNKNYSKGIKFYRKQFPFKKKVLVDASPSYLYNPDVPTRIKEHLPKDTKFIVSLREPVSRSYSAWNMYRDLKKNEAIIKDFHQLENTDTRYRLISTLYETEQFPSFEKTIEQELSLIEQGRSEEILEPSILRRGFYAKQIKEWFSYFPKENFFFLEDVMLKDENREATLSKMMVFLGIKNKISWKDINAKKSNTRKYRKNEKIDNALLEKLNKVFKKENEELEELTQLKLDWTCLK